jgi:hypothetical protein
MKTLEEIEALEKAATPGIWVFRKGALWHFEDGVETYLISSHG